MSGFAIYEFPFGFLKIGYEDDEVVLIKKVEDFDDMGQKSSFSDFVFGEITEYLNGTRRNFTFKCNPKGTEFQKRVWAQLCEIPYAETRTYKELAAAVGNENASRAIGNANNKNPIMIVYPCHRVIGSDRKLVGYAGGLDMKKALLQLESENK